MNNINGVLVAIVSVFLAASALGSVVYKTEKHTLNYPIVEVNKSNEADKSNVVALWEEMSISEKAAYIQENIELKLYSAPSKEILALALQGYENLVDKGEIKNNKLTVVDFSLSSSKPRLWVIDMNTYKIVLQSYVAHGKKTGQEFAQNFSNKLNSHQSSLGFYKTGETYQGRNGFSLRLDGLEKGLNDNARARAIVIHGANYANESLVQSQGFLGRSYGCPAVPTKVNKELINLIKNQSCLFIYHNSLKS